MNKLWLSIITAMAFLGCGHALMRGSVAMKVSDLEAHVCLGDHEVKVGDKVALFKNDCLPPRPGTAAARQDGYVGGCKKVKLGEGVVTQTLDEHYSVIKIDPGVEFKEGTVIEKYN